MKKLTLEDIKNRIAEHIANGGSIYDPRRELSYYDNLQKLTKRIQKSGNPDFTMEDAYKLCGYNFDREYADYLQLVESLKEYVDENNYVDAVKKASGSKSIKTLLKKMSTPLNCSPSDYLILMTDYRFSKAIIATDYIEQLRKELKQAYPNGDITNIKRENPLLYEKLRHTCKYYPEIGSDMQSIAEYFGLFNDRFSDTDIYQHLEIKKILREIIRLYPNGNIDNLLKENKTLYYQAVKCARASNMSFKEWCDENNLKYTQSQNTSKLAKTKVDAKQREAELFAIRKKITGSTEQEFSDPRDKYYYNKRIAQLILSELNQVKTQ